MKNFENVTVDIKANIYFDGKVVSHTVYTASGKKTLGLIYPGTYTFNTGAPELMQITAGICQVKIAGDSLPKTYETGSEFRVPGNSSFEIIVASGLAEYVCSFEG